MSEMLKAENGSDTQNIAKTELPVIIVTLLKGVIYRDNDPGLWSGLLKWQSKVREYVSVIGLELTLDEAEGYSFLRSPAAQAEQTDQVDKADKDLQMPRLVARRPLSFPVSLMLALLRKKMAEFDARGGDTMLVLTREEMVEMIRVFLPEGSNEVKLFNNVDTTINKIVDLGFLRRMKGLSNRHDTFEVRRILKAFVDAQWLSEFDERLKQYQQSIAAGMGDSSND